MSNITHAKEVWANQDKSEFDKAIESVMKRVNLAAAKGYRKTCFCPNYDLYDSVKAEFKKHGYEFRPSGMCGGVWQDSEDICW